MKRLLTLAIAAAATAVGFTPLQAEDIDLFVQPPGEAIGPPNVLIILDNTANWNDPFSAEMQALSETFQSLETNDDGSAKFRVGLMLFTESGGANKGEDGGYVRAAIRDLDAANQIKYAALVNSFDRLGDKSNGGKAGKTMADAYQYFSGLPPLTGNFKSKTDYTGNKFGLPAPALKPSRDIWDLPGNALTEFKGSPYKSPLQLGSCAGNFIIYISNGPVQDNNADNVKATGWLTTAATAAGVTGATTQIPISPTGSASNVADEWARFMRKSPRKIVTYTIDVKPKITGQTAGWTALLQSMASTSDGKYFDAGDGSNVSDIKNDLGIIFSEIQAVNSVFASVSLPVSVNPEGNYLNQLYIGMFRPDRNALPRWAGNLKQYKLGIVGDALRTLDADSKQAINTSTGFITECARSFWTPTTADSYWAFRPQGGCINPAGGNYDNSNFPDGKVVEKGAQAYVLRSSTTRSVRTCSSVFASCSTAGALLAFDATNVSKAALGDAAMTDPTQTAYIGWQKGLDLYDENINGTKDEMRSTVHGDIIHSRPIAINYGTDADRKIVVYYGGNDGVLRAVNGNRDTTIGAVTAGRELWSFIPPEFFGSIKRLHDNKITVSFVGNPAVDAEPKPYGMDGPITSYANNSLFVGMRRGGRALYAFNVTDIAADTPVAPQLLWKKGCPNLANDDDCSTGFADIGQTWSSARPFTSEGYVDVATTTMKPMLIMGGGYDACEDADPVTEECKDDGKGHRIYVLDAATGAKLKEFPTDRGVIGDVFVISDRFVTDDKGNDDPADDEFVMRAKWAYAADLGGNVYRISGDADAPNEPIGANLPAEWTIKKIASLGCDDAGDCEDNRKFMFMPDILEKDGTYYLLLGSGDREKPLDHWESAYETENYFFMIMDNPTDENWLSDEEDACGDDVMCLDSLQEIDDDNADLLDDIADKKGWYLPLRAHEQVVTSAITVFGTTTFSTHTPVVPVDGQCTSNLGTARVYNVRFLNASPRVGEDRSAEVAGGGLPPSPVAGQVTLDDGTTVPFIIGADPDSPLESKLPDSPSTGTQPKNLTYWYIEK